MKFRLPIAIATLLFAGTALAANPLVEMKTNFGNVVFELYPDKAPKTVSNFLNYVKSGFYKGTIFHRSVKNFVVQGGGFTPDLEPKDTQAPIPNEAGNGLMNTPGTLAMARDYDPQSATSQFFINLEDNKHLNHYRNDNDYYGYCVFGRVVSGMDVVKKINALPTTGKEFLSAGVPAQDVVIQDMAQVSSLPAGMVADKGSPAVKEAATESSTSRKKKARKHG
jgi:cyclophilin family peptidyl-prolyl cis-trans isomerase